MGELGREGLEELAKELDAEYTEEEFAEVMAEMSKAPKREARNHVRKETGYGGSERQGKATPPRGGIKCLPNR